MEKDQTAKSRFAKWWTDEEKRYLISHKTDGVELIAAALGRSIISVQIMASRLHVSLERIESELCPRCGKWFCYSDTSGRAGKVTHDGGTEQCKREYDGKTNTRW